MTPTEIIYIVGGAVSSIIVLTAAVYVQSKSARERVWREIDLAASLIKEKRPGANIQEATKLLEQARERMRRGDLRGALELAKKAQLAAKPTAEILIQEARSLASRAEEAFKREDFDGSIMLWSESIEKYRSAIEVAKERGEAELVERLEEAVERVRENIRRAEVALDNRKMVKMVEDAGRALKEGEEYLKSRDFDNAEASYLKGISLFEEALSIASKREEFREDRERISEAINRAKRLLIAAKIERGKKMMEDAEDLFKKGEYLKSKESFRKAREHLEKIRDEAAGLRLTEEIREIGYLIDVCNKNIDTATRMLVEVPEVVEARIISVRDIVIPTPAHRKVSPIQGFPAELLKYYENPELYGEGGTAWVYRAVWKKNKITVAIKIPKTLDERMGKAFMKEVGIWESLSHPNIVRIYDYNIIPVPYLTMEFVPSSLERLIEEGPVNVERASKIMFKVADALRYAHQKGIIHTDIKPSNILITPDYEPKIADWGLGRVLRVSRISESDLRGLTELYSAPEQFRNERLDERTDIFQFGIVFYELVTGKNPFEAESPAAVQHKILYEQVAPPSSINPAARPVDHIIMRCLEKERGKRYQSFLEVQRDLAEALGIEYSNVVKITRDRLDKIRLCCDLIEMSVSLKDAKKVIAYLKDLREYVKSEKLKNEIEGEISALEYYHSQGIEIDEDRKGRLREICEQALKGI